MPRPRCEDSRLSKTVFDWVCCKAIPLVTCRLWFLCVIFRWGHFLILDPQEHPTTPSVVQKIGTDADRFSQRYEEKNSERHTTHQLKTIILRDNHDHQLPRPHRSRCWCAFKDVVDYRILSMFPGGRHHIDHAAIRGTHGQLQQVTGSHEVITPEVPRSAHFQEFLKHPHLGDENDGECVWIRPGCYGLQSDFIWDCLLQTTERGHLVGCSSVPFE